ncbi:hypothetical protein SAMN05216235_0898 [Salinicoccus halodurans]|uniref:Uncharacterized protein n=1 Tax=Salinicoccus halodurans TaxID=407035 RepID=A0AA94HDJ8_9STAP|nr:hypothetical protein SAMN05216235_0898 [Salinicoccus halodurans]
MGRLIRRIIYMALPFLIRKIRNRKKGGGRK